MTTTDPAERQRQYRARKRAEQGPPPMLRLVEPTPLWFRFAACRPEYADRPIDQWVDQFFPGPGEATAPVKAICAECPAREACQEHGMAEHHGIFGGLSERERRRLRRKVNQHTNPAA